jgi:hypothetical protein
MNLALQGQALANLQSLIYVTIWAWISYRSSILQENLLISDQDLLTWRPRSTIICHHDHLSRSPWYHLTTKAIGRSALCNLINFNWLLRRNVCNLAKGHLTRVLLATTSHCREVEFSWRISWFMYEEGGFNSIELGLQIQPSSRSIPIRGHGDCSILLTTAVRS